MLFFTQQGLGYNSSTFFIYTFVYIVFCWWFLLYMLLLQNKKVISPFSCCLVEQSIQLCWFAAQIISNWWNMTLKFHIYGTNEKISGALSLDQSWIKSGPTPSNKKWVSSYQVSDSLGFLCWRSWFLLWPWQQFTLGIVALPRQWLWSHSGDNFISMAPCLH